VVAIFNVVANQHRRDGEKAEGGKVIHVSQPALLTSCCTRCSAGRISCCAGCSTVASPAAPAAPPAAPAADPASRLDAPPIETNRSAAAAINIIAIAGLSCFSHNSEQGLTTPVAVLEEGLGFSASEVLHQAAALAHCLLSQD
jgi:hypothetical protein